MKSSSRVIILTGLSGSGKTVALRALEDAGYFCIDNLPLPLLPNLLEISKDSKLLRNIAVGIDIREKGLLRNIEEKILNLKQDFIIDVIFLEAERSILVRRFKETRRPHPLSVWEDDDIANLIEKESLYLKSLRYNADRVIDTSSYTPHQLRKLIMGLFGNASTGDMKITLISFGYKYGIPQSIDLLFDIRFLPNPHFVPQLRELTGLDRPVREYVLTASQSKTLLQKVTDLLGFLIEQYRNEGKSSIIIGIGCTGGRHRSPVIAEELRNQLSKMFSLKIEMIHREL